MTITEKVTQGLRCFASKVPPTDCSGCPYEGKDDCEHAIIEDIIPVWGADKISVDVKPVEVKRRFLGIPVQKYKVCGECGQELHNWMHYCPECGRGIG